MEVNQGRETSGPGQGCEGVVSYMVKNCNNSEKPFRSLSQQSVIMRFRFLEYSPDIVHQTKKKSLDF